MKRFGLMMMGAIVLLASLAVACGGSDSPNAASDQGGGVAPSGGLVARDKFMTYDGHRYQLVNMIFEEMVPAEQFQAVGMATQADVDMSGDMQVFVREGDSTAVYTHSGANQDDNGVWLAWRLAS